MNSNSISRLRSDLPGLITVLRLISMFFRKLGIRGYGKTTNLLGKLVGKRKITAEFKTGDKFEFPAMDSYWSCLFDSAIPYEPELHHLFNRLKQFEYSFIDAGANMGFWSVQVSGNSFGQKPCIAVEGSIETFNLLEQNCRINGNRFLPFHNAIFSSDGQKLGFSSGNHAGRHLQDLEGVGEQVETVTLDTIWQKFGKDATKPVIVKLDVEGAEIQGLKGASNLLKHPVIFLYEDHGKDMNHDVSRYFMSELKFKIFYIVEEDGRLAEITNIKQLSAIKKNSQKGYMFAACNSDSIFLEVLDKGAT